MADDHVASLPPADRAAREGAFQRRRTERATRGRSLTVVVRSGRLRMTAQTIIVPRARRVFTPLDRRTMSGGVDGAKAVSANALGWVGTELNLPISLNTTDAMTFDSSIPGAIDGQCVKYHWPLNAEWLPSHTLFPNTVGNGGEVWVRTRMYIPTGWDWTTTDSSLKWQRVAGFAWDYADSQIEPTSFLDFKVKVTTGAMVGLSQHSAFMRTVTPESSAAIPADLTADWGRDSAAIVFPNDEWFTYEYYIKIDGRLKANGQNQPLDEGGVPILRTWINGILRQEVLLQQTLFNTHASSYLEGHRFIDYWNGLCPQTQDYYIDEYVMTDHTNLPINTDAAGNRYIGNWSA